MSEIEAAIARLGPDTIIEAMTPLLSEDRRRRIDEILASRIDSLTIVLENLYDAHNGAAAARSVEAFGLTDLYAVESRERFKISQGVSIGCDQWLEIHRHRDLPSCLDRLKQRGMVLTATLPDATMTIEELDGARPRALLFGNEHEGLTDEAIGQCDELVRIPMFGFTQSFNLSVSVALTVERAAALRRAALGCPGDLSEERKHYLRAKWYTVGQRGALEIIERYVSSRTQ